MLPFRTAPDAVFRCRVDLSVEPVFNLNFLDAALASIPFHVSLRRDHGIVVVNRMDARGWRRELIYSKTFQPGGTAVDIRFSRLRCALWVEEELIGRFDRFPRPSRTGRFFLRRGFPALREIAHVAWEGAMAPGTLALSSVAITGPWRGCGLVVNDRMEAVWRGLDEAAAARLAQQGLQVQVDGMDTPLEVARIALPYLLPEAGAGHEYALIAVLPGRIWVDSPEQFHLRLVDLEGTVLASANLSRHGLRETIERQAQTALLRHDDLAALQLLEHVRFSGLMPALSPRARAELSACADFFGLGAWFSDRDEAATEHASPAESTTPAVAGASPQPGMTEGNNQGAEVTDAVQSLRDRFTAGMRARPDQDPVALLRGLLAAARLGREQEEMALTVATEWFCTHGDPRGLYRLAQECGHRATAPDMGDAWHLSSSLPMLYLHGRFDEVGLACGHLVRQGSGWLITQALAWVVDQAAQRAPDAAGRRPDAGQRDAILEAFLKILVARAYDYWGRIPCQTLMRAGITMLLQKPALPTELGVRAQTELMRLYALSPSFWALIDAQMPEAEREALLSPAVHDARESFHRLASLVLTDHGPDREACGAELSRHLDALARFECYDMPRFRRDLLGPLQMPPQRDGGMCWPTADNRPDLPYWEAEEATLRWMAFPRPVAALPALTDTQADTLAETAGRAVAAAWRDVPQSDNLPLQTQLARRALALASQKSPTESDLKRLIDDLSPLCTRDQAFLGLTLLLRLASTLLHLGNTAFAARLIDAATAAVARVPAKEGIGIFAEPGPSLALSALNRAPGGAALACRLDGGAMPTGSAPAGHDQAIVTAPLQPFFDTLVCVYSCRANLDTRIETLRRTWLGDLQALGVGFLIFVGDGDGTRTEDIVYLDAPDDYEGLPQKTLAMARWVKENTAFSYLLKVDDDCFLEAETFFHSLSFLRHDYHGRRLHRVRGQMDRSWHMAKAGSPRGRLELDKSPEPSSYADGGSGYVLSRRAMAVLCDMAKSGEGRSLIQRSFMEDKLVGDLLALAGIRVANLDYRVAVMRRSRPGGPLVPQWENGFLPFRGAGISMAHLDGTEHMAEVQGGKRSTWPTPMKIWPSFQPLRLGSRSNTLDLMSSPERLARVNAAPVAVVACLRNEAFMLPHFLNHYRALGVEGFLIADNGSDDATLDILAEAPDVALFSVDTEYNQSQYGVAWQQALLSNLRPGRWSLVADADELLVPGDDWQTGGLPALVQGGDFADADAARLFMLDMYPAGPLSKADFSSGDPFKEAGYTERHPFLTVSGSLGPFSSAPVFTSALRHRLIPGSRAELFVAQKYALLKYRPWMRLSAGLHFVAEARVAPRDLIFAHFKYNAAFRAKAMEEVARRQHFNNAEEYAKYLALVSEGREIVFDPAVSVPWRESGFVQNVMTGQSA